MLLLTPFLFVIARIEMIILLGPFHGLIAVVKSVLKNFSSSQTNLTQSKKTQAVFLIPLFYLFTIEYTTHFQKHKMSKK